MEEEEEGLQEPINPYWYGEKYLLGVEYSEKAREALGLMMGSFGHFYYVNPDDDDNEGRLIFQEEEEEEDDKEAQVQQQCCLAKEEEEEEERSTSTIMPSFVKMLQESGVSHVESLSPSPLLFPVGLKEEGSFQKNLTQVLVRGAAVAVVVDHELTDQSCLTNQLYHDHVFQPVVVKEGTSSFGEYDGGPRASARAKRWSHESEADANAKRSCSSTSSRRRKSSSSTTSSSRKKRKMMIVKREEEEVERQRMTHIAVERNRRRQMNDHLNSLRSLMPPSYLQRGDQASIIGGAIDFVKELEQLLESLEGHKRIISSKKFADQGDEDRDRDTNLTTSSFSSSSVVPPLEMNQMMMSGNNIIIRGGPEEKNNTMCSEGGRDAHGGLMVKVRVRVIQNHVNLKVEYCDENNRRPPPGQLLNAIVALENLRLTVLHLNITTFQPSSSSSSSVHYSFNLKVEDDCRVGSAAEIERSVHGIFNGSCS